MATEQKHTPCLVTHFVFPPIPLRSSDWCAFYEGEEEAGGYGYGATEEDAIRDFNENCRDDHDERLGIARATGGQSND